MGKVIDFGFAAKYFEHCRKFEKERECVINALKGKHPDNAPLLPPKVGDIIKGYGGDTRQGVVYLAAENWVLDTHGHKMTEPFMFSYHRQGNDIIFDM